jgi:hypothetical protein
MKIKEKLLIVIFNRIIEISNTLLINYKNRGEDFQKMIEDVKNDYISKFRG